MSREERKKRSRRTNLIIALLLAVFAFFTYIMTFVIAHLVRQQ